MEWEMIENEIEDALDAFFADGLISEVLNVVRSGKEATVYCCTAGASTGKNLLAAKVYRPLEERSFRNDAIYQPGRNRTLGRRDKLALERKSRHGRDLQFGVWINSEFQTLATMRAAGARVPEPYSQSHSAILMEYFGDAGGAAPMLSRVTLSRGEAEACLRQIFRTVTLLLENHLVHGDLSPYNILYWSGQPVVIDFPQAVDARFNPNARDLLERDLDNVCGYFARAGVRADGRRLANEMWQRYRTGMLQTG
jgi:RIO kinase 1